MEYIYSLTGQRKLVIYDGANSITALFIEKSKNTGWTPIEHDYRIGLVCTQYENSIYIAYISVANEIIVKRMGESGRLVLFSDPNNALNIKDIKLMVSGGGLYVLYVITNAHSDKDELWYTDVYGDRKNIRLISCDGKISDCGIWDYNNKTYLTLSGENGGEDKAYILQKNEKGIYYEPCGIISGYEGRLAEYGRKTALYEEQIAEYERKSALYEEQIAEYERKTTLHEEQLAEYENQFRKQYAELSELTKQIQEEGKRWRELYYRSIKKTPT